ncbi:putative zinc-binding protein [Humidesulfovibrio sp.]
MSSNCCRPAAMPLILACSGGSNVGQATNQVALELTREGRGKMFCLAGLGGDIAGIIKTVREAGETDGVIVLDGCALGCAKGIMERAGLPLGTYLVATDLGIEKVKDSQLLVRQEDVDKLKAAAIGGARA